MRSIDRSGGSKLVATIYVLAKYPDDLAIQYRLIKIVSHQESIATSEQLLCSQIGVAYTPTGTSPLIELYFKPLADRFRRALVAPEAGQEYSLAFVPASDRVVSIKDNQPVLNFAKELEELASALSQSNSFQATPEGQRTTAENSRGGRTPQSRRGQTGSASATSERTKVRGGCARQGHDRSRRKDRVENLPAIAAYFGF